LFVTANVTAGLTTVHNIWLETIQ